MLKLYYKIVNASWVRQNYNISDYLKGKTWKEVLGGSAGNGTGVKYFSENISGYRYIRLEGHITKEGLSSDTWVWYGEIALLKSIGEQFNIINIAGTACNYIMRNLTDTSITISQYGGTSFNCRVWVI